MKVQTVRQFIITESEAKALHDILAELSLNEHRRMLANPSLKGSLYNGSVEDAHVELCRMYNLLHIELTSKP